MIYKVGNIKEINNIPNLKEGEQQAITKFAKILTEMYGDDRDIDHDMGGYILFATEDTTEDEIKEEFDYSEYLVEYIEEFDNNTYAAVYLVSTEFAVVLIMSGDDFPAEIYDDAERQTYTITICETLSKKVRVNAVTPQEAMRKVKTEYKHGEIVLTADDFTDVNFKEEEKC